MTGSPRPWKKRRHIVTEAVFASKQVEELAEVVGRTVLTFVFAEVSGLSKYFLVSDRPGYARNRKSEK